MRSLTPGPILIAGAAACALGIVFASGTIVGDRDARAAIATLPTQTSHVITRTITKTVTRIVVATATPVIYATPVPTTTPEPPVPDDRPQHPLNGATYCTIDHVCVTLTGYTLTPSFNEKGDRALNVWFHVVNGDSEDNGLDTDQLAAGIKGGAVVGALPIPSGPNGEPQGQAADGALVTGGSTDGSESFFVPGGSHEVNVRLIPPFSVMNDQTPYGSWDIQY